MTTVNPVTHRMHEAWKSMIGWVNVVLDRLSDEELAQPVAEGCNHGVWILGHLVESEDELSMYLGTGPMLWPEYEELFGMKSPLKSPAEYPSVATLRLQWKTVCEKNDHVLSNFTDEQWDTPHALRAESEQADFYGTKGRCIQLWMLHEMYHAGQLSIPVKQLGRNRA